MKLRILHAATHGHNIGDGALVAGMHRVLREDLGDMLGAELEFTPLDVLGHKLRRRRDMLPRREAREVLAAHDLVLVGGGGMIEGGKGNYLSGINFNFHLDVLRDSPVPWVFYALGHNQFRRTFFFHRRRLRRLLRLAADGAHPFSVRNDGSEERLRKLVGDAGEVTTVPDPGLWVPEGPGQTPEMDSPGPRLLVQLAGDRGSKRFRQEPEVVLRRLGELLQRLIEERGVTVTLCPHLLGDLPLCTGLLRHLPDRVQRPSVSMTPVMHGAGAAPAFFDRYRRADLVLGMRGHSVICAVGTGTPVVGLASHDKVGGFLREVGLGEWAVDLDRDRRLEELERVLVGMLGDLEAARRRTAATVPALRRAARRFHERIAERLRS
jgi:polysaccharide pyruvyl transferase WcaK-like protein